MNRLSIRGLLIAISALLFTSWAAHREYLRAQAYSASSGGYAALSGSIGGSLLLVGASASGTVTVTGAQVGMNCLATASDGTNMVALGIIPTCSVTAANTVTVNVIAIISLTPAAKTYNVRVFP